MKEIPLTGEQKLFAEMNHGLVFKYLNENRLAMEDYYDIVVFGYLKAIKRYFTEPKLQQYSFSTIAWRRMDAELKNYYKSQHCQMRNAEIISIHADLYQDGPSLESILPARDELMQQVEEELLLHELARRVSKQQMDMVRLKTSGYGIQDIARKQKISMKVVKTLLEEVRGILMELCRE